MDQKTRADSIIAYLKSFIERNKLEVLTRYPNDLFVHDRNQFEELAMPGMRFGWKADNSSTHLITIGIHPKEMELIPTLAVLNSDSSKFLEIFITGTDVVQYTEHTAKSFTKLATLPVHYSAAADVLDRRIYRVDSSGCVTRNLGRIALTNRGYLDGSTTRTFEAKIYQDPDEGKPADLPILKLWASHAITEAAGTLFVRSIMTVVPPNGATRRSATPQECRV